MNLPKRREIFKRFAKNNPHPTTELIYHSPFELLVSVILSAQATDKSVNLATQKLFKIAKTPEGILNLGEKGLKKFTHTIGLYNTKTRNILKTCEVLIDQYDSKVPKDREALESLAGVGRKTANVILNTIFGECVIAVDTHIFRVSNRTKLAEGKTPMAVEKKLLKVTPKEYLKDAHHWLVLHGRYICIARKPRCGSCLISDLCEYENKAIDFLRLGQEARRASDPTFS